MSDADIVRQGFEHHTGPPPGTEEALDRLERERAAGEAIFVELFQVAIDAHGRLVDRNEALQDENELLRAAVGRMHEWLVSIEGAIIAPETVRPVLNALYDQTRAVLESAGREGAEPTGAHNPGPAGSTPAPATDGHDE